MGLEMVDTTTSKLGADMHISENDMARVLFANLFPRGMCPADWDSGAILGPGNIVRKQFLDSAREVLDFIARQPAAIDKQEAVAICTICNGYGRYQDGNSGTEADGYAPNIVECECVLEERHPSAPSVEQDERKYTQADMERYGKCYADARDARLAKDAQDANVAQGAEAAVGADKALELLQALIPMTDNSDSPVRNFHETLKVIRDALTAAPPAQTAIADDARDAARYRWLRKEHFPTSENPPLAQVVWKAFDYRHSSDWANIIDGNDLDRAIDAALTAAQSASGDTK